MTESTAQEKDEIREVVRQRYAAAATKVAREGLIAESGLQMLDEAACCGTQSCSASVPSERSVITSDITPSASSQTFRRQRCWLHSAAGTRPRSPSSRPAKPCLTWDLAAALMFCSRPGGWVRLALPTAST
jgi:hypothetical protein